MASTDLLPTAVSSSYQLLYSNVLYMPSYSIASSYSISVASSD